MLELKQKFKFLTRCHGDDNSVNALLLPWQQVAILNILHPTISMPSYNVTATTMHYIGHPEDIHGKMEVYALVNYIYVDT